MLEKKIALLTSVTFNNIGNGFIDLGAEAALMKALPLNAELFKVSSNANFAATMGQMFMLKENPIINWLWVHTMQRAAKKLHDRSYKTVKTQNIFSMASMVEGGNLAASKIRNLECPSYEICLIDYGCGKFNRKIHIMEQYP